MSNALRWGVLGTSKIAREHVLPGLKSCAAAQVVAIGSRDKGRAQAIAETFGVAKAYGSYAALLADPDIDAVYNPLPNHLHATLTIQALEAGKHVLCEKPIALSAEGARRIEVVQRKTGLVVAEAFMVLHHPQWRRVREIVQSGRLGDVRAMHALFSYFLTDPLNIRNQSDIGGGGLYDVGCYAVATSRFIFGYEPERVVGLFATDPTLGTDYLASGLVEFPGHRQLAFTCSTQLVPCQKVQILGATGRLQMDVPFNPRADAQTTIVVDDGRDLTGGGCETILLPPCDQYALQAEAFARAVRGEAAVEWGVADAILNMRVLDALFRSGRSRGWEAP